jgi:phosphoribosylaminoimidazole carboxylase PurE protein
MIRKTKASAKPNPAAEKKKGLDVAVLIGSESDHDVVKDALALLDEFGVSHLLAVSSAHRSPDRTRALVKDFQKRGTQVFIAVAGKAAHLAGFVAAHTVAPVIGVPVESAGLGGLDALLSTVQMPKGIPVATMGTGKTGASNAAILAVEILSLKNPLLRRNLKEYRKKLASEVAGATRRIRKNA